MNVVLERIEGKVQKSYGKLFLYQLPRIKHKEKIILDHNGRKDPSGKNPQSYKVKISDLEMRCRKCI